MNALINGFEAKIQQAVDALNATCYRFNCYIARQPNRKPNSSTHGPMFEGERILFDGIKRAEKILNSMHTVTKTMKTIKRPRYSL